MMLCPPPSSLSTFWGEAQSGQSGQVAQMGQMGQAGQTGQAGYVFALSYDKPVRGS